MKKNTPILNCAILTVGYSSVLCMNKWCKNIVERCLMNLLFPIKVIRVVSKYYYLNVNEQFFGGCALDFEKMSKPQNFN